MGVVDRVVECRNGWGGTDMEIIGRVVSRVPRHERAFAANNAVMKRTCHRLVFFFQLFVVGRGGIA